MAAGFACTSGASFSMATGAKTILNLIAPTNAAPPLLVEFGISFDGTNNAAVPAVVELCASTQATAGTPGTIGTITQIRGYAGVTAQSTTAGQYTAEPTVLTPVKSWFVPQFMGTFTIQFPLGREPAGFDTASTSMKGIALRVNTSATVNARAYFEWDE